MKLHTLTIRGLPEPLLKVLRSAAKRSRRSLNAEVLVRLEVGAAAVDPVPVGRPAPAGGDASASPAASAARVRESAGPPYEVRKAFDEARVSLVESDLKMTPEERVLLADRMLDDALAARPRPNVHTIRAFDSWEDYLAWKRTDFLL
jgi:plasmid stability protein